MVNQLYSWHQEKLWVVLKTKLWVFLKQTQTTENYGKPRKSKLKQKSEVKMIREIKQRMIWNIKNLSEEEQHYCKSVKECYFYSNNYVKC